MIYRVCRERFSIDMSSYLISEILLILFIALWGWARHDLAEERKDSERLQKQNANLKEANSRAWEEIGELKTQRQKDLKALICYLLAASKKRAASERMVQEIYDNLHYVGNIITVDDFLKYDFDYILKVVKYAKKGMLDVYQNYELYGDRSFRVGRNGEHIFLSEEEEEKMSKCDYSFIFHIS